MTSILISGGFDPLHGGHVDLIKSALARCGPEGEVWVALNSDAWLMRKKGYVFMPWDERAEIMANQHGVTTVYPVKDDDGTVNEAIQALKPDMFANGGDRGCNNVPELDACKACGTVPLFGVGGAKRSSSSVLAPQGWVLRQWGRYVRLSEGDKHVSKILEFNGNGATSYQRHRHRTEVWLCIKGNVTIDLDGAEVNLHPGGTVVINPMTWHQAWGDKGSQVVEVWMGRYQLLSEDDKEEIAS